MKPMNAHRLKVAILGMVLTSAGCGHPGRTSTSVIEPGNDPHFVIVPHADEGFSGFNRKVEVFGIPIYALPKVEDSKLLHAANVMAQYLDNNEDGTVDNQLVLDKMLQRGAFVAMWHNDPEELMQAFGDEEDFAALGDGQDLGSEETHPSFVSGGKTGPFDAALEEILHIINVAGHARAYPDAFGLHAGSDLAEAMDLARGGKFMAVPDPYPAEAWYSYDDETCEYADCQTIEYLYWALTSMLGAQESRLDEIRHEWKLNTRDLVESRDTAIFALLTDPVFLMPTYLPDGTYRH